MVDDVFYNKKLHLKQSLCEYLAEETLFIDIDCCVCQCRCAVWTTKELLISSLVLTVLHASTPRISSTITSNNTLFPDVIFTFDTLYFAGVGGNN